MNLRWQTGALNFYLTTNSQRKALIRSKVEFCFFFIVSGSERSCVLFTVLATLATLVRDVNFY